MAWKPLQFSCKRKAIACLGVTWATSQSRCPTPPPDGNKCKTVTPTSQLREAQRGGAWIEQACHALGWRLPTSRFTTREVPHRFRGLYTTTNIHTYMGFQEDVASRSVEAPQRLVAVRGALSRPLATPCTPVAPPHAWTAPYMTMCEGNLAW